MHLYLNGSILPDDQARVSVHDHGLLYGAGCFETFRSFDGNVFRLEQHLRRLRAGCDRLRIATGPDSLLSREVLLDAIRKLLISNDLKDAVFRLTLTGGPVHGGLPRAPYDNPTELLVPRPVGPSHSAPIGLHLLKTPRNSPDFEPRPKSLAYLNSLAGHLELCERAVPAGDEGLMLTARGRLAEGVTTNLFLIEGKHLVTPGADADILLGITRGFILETAGTLGISTREESCSVENLETADAIFLTNAVRGLIPVERIYDASDNLMRRLKTRGNSVFKTFTHAYSQALKDSATH